MTVVIREFTNAGIGQVVDTDGGTNVSREITSFRDVIAMRRGYQNMGADTFPAALLLEAKDGSGSVGIVAPDIISDDYDLMLPEDPPTVNQILSVASITSGSVQLEFVANTGGGGGIAAVVDDTTPQLGGDLDAQNNNITNLATVEIDDGSNQPYLVDLNANAFIVQGQTGSTVALMSLVPADTNGSDDVWFRAHGEGDVSDINRHYMEMGWDASDGVYRITMQASGTEVVRDIVMSTDGNAWQLVLENDSDVGIGVENPSAKLDVGGDINGSGALDIVNDLTITTGQLLADEGTAAAPGISFSANNDYGLYHLPGSSTIGLSANGTAHFYITNNGIFSTMDFDADVVSLTANISAITQCADWIFANTTTTLGAKLTLREGSDNGTSGVSLEAPDSMSANYSLIEADTVPNDHTGIVMETSGSESTRKYSEWANAICLDFEEGSNLATGTSSGFQYSVGNGDVGDFGTVVPFDFEIIAIAACALSHPAGNTVTIEVYKGTGLAASTSTGVDVTIPDAAGSAYADFSGAPVAGSAGDWLVPKTTAKTGSGNINGGRVSIWIRPIE